MRISVDGFGAGTPAHRCWRFAGPCGDLHTLGADGVRFFTELKSVTARWFSDAGAREGRVLNSWDGMISIPNQ
jgi:hypothetical protein